MASHLLVTAEQVASAGRTIGVCYYCGAPLGAAHHSYCTLVKALPASYGAPPPHHQYEPQASTFGYGVQSQLPESGQTFWHSTAPAAESASGHAQWQQYDSQWFPASAAPPDTSWHEPAPPSPPPPPPPPPGPEEGPPPLPPEDGQAPLPPAEQPPPPPEGPAGGGWGAGQAWDGAQAGHTESAWGSQAGSSGMGAMLARTNEPGQQDALSGGLRWEEGPHAHGGILHWEGSGWGHAGGGTGEASSAPPAHEQPPDRLPSGQHQSLGPPQVLSHPGTSVGPAEGAAFAPPPWQRPGGQPGSTELPTGAAPPAGGQLGGGAGRGSGMESIRDLYAAPSQQRAGAHALQSMLQGGAYLGLPDPRPMVAPTMTLPFPLPHTPTPPLVSLPEQPRRVDARDIFKQPGRSTRPDRFVVILRGLPGSGKSHLARALRDVEVMNGGSAPRVHTMDDYFVTEVEKEVEVEDARGKKRTSAQTAMEYVYEPELEQAYCASMLKAFRKTLDEGRFHFVIVEYWNLVVSDFEPYWKAAKSSGFEVYVLQPAKLDPEACARRNIHGFSLDAVAEMARRWEPLPPQFLQLDVQSLFRGDLLDTGDITEVDMDADPDPPPAAPPTAATKRPLYESDEEDVDTPHHAPPSRPSARPDRGAFRDRDGKRRAPASPSRRQPAQPEATPDAAGKGGPRKEVKWADLEGEKEAAKGFRIGVDLSKKRKLEIGPGAGYTQDQTGPLQQSSAREHAAWARKVKAQVRDEAEAFKAVVARRRQRIGVEEDDD